MNVALSQDSICVLPAQFFFQFRDDELDGVVDGLVEGGAGGAGVTSAFSIAQAPADFSGVIWLGGAQAQAGDVWLVVASEEGRDLDAGEVAQHAGAVVVHF